MVIEWAGFAVALAALGLLAWFVAAFARAQLPQAQALMQLNKLDAEIDNRIGRVIERLRQREHPEKRTVAPPSLRPADARPPDPFQGVFDPGGIEPLEDQPEMADIS